MITLKRIGISIASTVGALLLLTLLLTIFSYFNLFGIKVISTMKMMIPIISLFIGGFIMGKQSKEKGWLEGLKMGFVFVIVLFLFNILGVHMSWEWKHLIYDGILIICSIFGSIIGINFKRKEA